MVLWYNTGALLFKERTKVSEKNALIDPKDRIDCYEGCTPMRMMIVTGGTGGHIYPALALADAGKSSAMVKQAQIAFVGNDDRMEASLIPEKGYPFSIRCTPADWSAACAAKVKSGGADDALLIGRQRAISIAFRPDIVIGFGGYVSAPLILAAHHLGVVTMIHEQNSIVGKANQLVMKQVDAIVCCYERCLSQLDAHEDAAVRQSAGRQRSGTGCG